MTPRLRASDARGMRLEFARVEKCLAFRLQSPVSRHADRREDTMTKVPRARKQGVAKSQTGSDTAILALEELRHWRKYCGCACACACERARCVRAGPDSRAFADDAGTQVNSPLPPSPSLLVGMSVLSVFSPAPLARSSSSPPHSSFPCPLSLISLVAHPPVCSNRDRKSNSLSSLKAPLRSC